jgi:hypothetical protein
MAFKQFNIKKPLFVNFLFIFGVGKFKVLKLFKIFGFSPNVKNKKVEPIFKLILIKSFKQNFIYSRFKFNRKLSLKIKFLKKIKNFSARIL